VKKYEEQIKTETKQVLVEVSCDLCGAITKDGDWGDLPIRVEDTRVEYRTGDSWGTDGCDINEYVIDICPKCFMDKLIPFVESHGKKIVPREIRL